jgi:hypothetical protein
MVFIMGCGMFGDSRLYTGLLGLCAKCHAENGTPPSKATVLPEAGPMGNVGKTEGAVCPTKCTFKMGTH